MMITFYVVFMLLVSQKNVLSRVGKDVSDREPAMYDVKRFNIPIFAEESGLTWDDYIATNQRVKLWPNGRIRYTLYGNFSNDFKANLRDNIFYFHHSTCIRIEINEELCNKFTDLSHLIMHVLGFDHEFVRKDRDKYITLREHNIDPKYQHLFDKDEHYNTYVQVPYNPYSVLHPTSYDMGKNTGDLVFNWWFTDIDGGIIRNRNTLHIYDMMNVNLLYRCGRSNQNCRDELSPGLCSNLGKGDETGPLVDGIVMFVEKAKCWNDTFAAEECRRTCGHCYMYDVPKRGGRVNIDQFFTARETSRLTAIHKALEYMDTISGQNSKKRRGVSHKTDWWE